ncbi:hypothetical protein NDU88_011869 [Pleurodeles waltl]|uniref:Uncharacterized protein n=1 Tax=Pleurodeles waltl TaxID=8319 RepID=A0AAV7S2G1_PLEWA|nr:hypothetical protein NDU88_011869 [Pleurodeles waltl]
MDAGFGLVQMMSHARWMIAVWFASLDYANKPRHIQSSWLVEYGAAPDQEGPRGFYPRGEVRGGSQQLREPSEDQAAQTGVPQHGDKEGSKGGPHSTTQRDPTPPENHAGGCASQVRVLGDAAALCTKKFVEGCQQALEPPKNTVHGGTVLHGEASSYLHQSWATGP